MTPAAPGLHASLSLCQHWNSQRSRDVERGQQEVHCCVRISVRISQIYGARLRNLKVQTQRSSALPGRTQSDFTMRETWRSVYQIYSEPLVVGLPQTANQKTEVSSLFVLWIGGSVSWTQLLFSRLWDGLWRGQRSRQIVLWSTEGLPWRLPNGRTVDKRETVD